MGLWSKKMDIFNEIKKDGHFDHLFLKIYIIKLKVLVMKILNLVNLSKKHLGSI